VSNYVSISIGTFLRATRMSYSGNVGIGLAEFQFVGFAKNFSTQARLSLYSYPQ